VFDLSIRYAERKHVILDRLRESVAAPVTVISICRKGPLHDLFPAA
jgi:hypothetical protein